MSNWTEENVAKWMYGGTPSTKPAAWYLALFSGDPSEDGTANELTGGGYARQSFTPALAGTPDFGISNTALITFPTATGNWSTITYVGIFSAVTAGSFYDYGTITTQRTVLTDGVLKFNAGELDIVYS